MFTIPLFIGRLFVTHSLISVNSDLIHISFVAFWNDVKEERRKILKIGKLKNINVNRPKV